MAKNETGLTLEQKQFVDEFLVDLNATQAYRRAFPGTSYGSAGVLAARMLKNVRVAKEVKAARKALSKRTQITAEKVLREYARIAFSDIGDLFTPDGRLASAKSIPLEARRAISSVKVGRQKTTRMGETEIEESEIEYKLWPKTEALSKLFNHLGLSSEITPLDALLAALPKQLSEQVRQAIAGDVHPPSDPPDAEPGSDR